MSKTRGSMWNASLAPKKLFSRNKEKASRDLVCGDIWTSSPSVFIPSRSPMFYPDITIFCGAWLVATKHFSLKVLFFFFLLLANFSATLVLHCFVDPELSSVISTEVTLAGRRGVFLSRINKPYLNNVVMWRTLHPRAPPLVQFFPIWENVLSVSGVLLSFSVVMCKKQKQHMKKKKMNCITKWLLLHQCIS